MMSQLTKHRPRVEGEREDEILEATIELILEVGYDRLTMDAVAKRARASKATLYRRWESKASLVVDAMVKAKSSPHMEDQDNGDLRADLLGTFCGKEGLNETSTALFGAVLTAVCTDPEFAALFRERFIAPKFEITSAIYRRAQERGEIRDDLDLEVIVPALPGILLHRMFILGIPPDDVTITRVVDEVILPAVRHQSHAGNEPSADRDPVTSRARKTP